MEGDFFPDKRKNNTDIWLMKRNWKARNSDTEKSLKKLLFIAEKIRLWKMESNTETLKNIWNRLSDLKLYSSETKSKKRKKQKIKNPKSQTNTAWTDLETWTIVVRFQGLFIGELIEVVLLLTVLRMERKSENRCPLVGICCFCLRFCLYFWFSQTTFTSKYFLLRKACKTQQSI